MMAPRELTEAALRRWPLPEPSADGDKNDRGRVLIVAGSLAVPGAALLAAEAALRSGAGKLQIGVCAGLAVPIGLAAPEALVFGLPHSARGGVAAEAAPLIVDHARDCDGLAFGPGMIDEPSVAEVLAALLAMDSPPPMVLDAAALSRLTDATSMLRALKRPAVITPHAGEMAGCLGLDIAAVRADPAGVAQAAARDLNVVVVMKGAVTHIADPDGRVWIGLGGSKGLATSGSGDTLAGLIAGLLARGADPVQAAAWGVFVHARAGAALGQSVGPLGFLARELPAQFPPILGDLAG